MDIKKYELTLDCELSPRGEPQLRQHLITSPLVVKSIEDINSNNVPYKKRNETSDKLIQYVKKEINNGSSVRITDKQILENSANYGFDDLTRRDISRARRELGILASGQRD